LFDVLLLGSAPYASWKHAKHGGLVVDDLPAGAGAAIERRILVAQTRYAFGALLCIISTYVSIAFIVRLSSTMPSHPGSIGGSSAHRKPSYSLHLRTRDNMCS